MADLNIPAVSVIPSAEFSEILFCQEVAVSVPLERMLCLRKTGNAVFFQIQIFELALN